MDVGRPALWAAGERLKQIGEIGVAVPLDELCDIVPPVSAARLADEREERAANVGEDERSVAGHDEAAAPCLFQSFLME
jgi:hypothetical protein